jgi:amino acid permease
MTTKKFIIKTIVMIFIFAILSTIVMTLLSSGVFTNEIALGQMQNDNVEYLIWQEYQALIPIFFTAYGCITVGLVGKISYDTYKFIKTKTKEKNENEEK